MEIIKLFKRNRKIVCYIEHSYNHFNVHTGKPSDSFCIGWTYENLEDAMNTATEYFENYTKPF